MVHSLMPSDRCWKMPCFCCSLAHWWLAERLRHSSAEQRLHWVLSLIAGVGCRCTLPQVTSWPNHAGWEQAEGSGLCTRQMATHVVPGVQLCSPI